MKITYNKNTKINFGTLHLPKDEKYKNLCEALSTNPIIKEFASKNDLFVEVDSLLITRKHEDYSWVDDEKFKVFFQNFKEKKENILKKILKKIQNPQFKSVSLSSDYHSLNGIMNYYLNDRNIKSVLERLSKSR